LKGTEIIMFASARYRTLALVLAAALPLASGGCGSDPTSPADPAPTSPRIAADGGTTVQNRPLVDADPADACIATCLERWRVCLHPRGGPEQRSMVPPPSDEGCATLWSTCVSACLDQPAAAPAP
jgi:hypothetical protein